MDLPPSRRELSRLLAQHLLVQRWKLPEVVLPARNLPRSLALVLPKRGQDPELLKFCETEKSGV